VGVLRGATEPTKLWRLEHRGTPVAQTTSFLVARQKIAEGKVG
jgi:hypothetical protein